MFFHYLGYHTECDNPSPLLYSLPDSSLTASSVLNNEYSVRGPQRSRLFMDQSDGVLASAWNGDGTLPDQWIQVDLLTPRMVQAVQVQARAEIFTPHWIRIFKLALSLDANAFDVILLENGDERIFYGPTELDEAVRVQFDATSARYVRLMVLTFEGVIAVRWEVYGCLDCKLYLYK